MNRLKDDEISLLAILRSQNRNFLYPNRDPFFRTGFSLNRHRNSPNRVTIQVNRVPIFSYKAHESQMYGPNREENMPTCPDSVMSNAPLPCLWNRVPILSNCDTFWLLFKTSIFSWFSHFNMLKLAVNSTILGKLHRKLHDDKMSLEIFCNNNIL